MPMINKWGFTLIEYLVVIGILVAALSSTMLFLTAILKSVNQSNIIAEVKQNGQAILDSLESEIRNAVVVECKNASGNPILCSDPQVFPKYLKLIRLGTNPLHIKCFSDGPTPKVQNGWIGTKVSTDSNPADGSYLNLSANSDLITGVDIQNCNFTVYPTSTGLISPPVVNISFVVNQAINAPSRPDFSANVKFQTTISLRNY